MHPKVEAFYKKNDLQYVKPVHDRVREDFMSNTQLQPRTTEIDKIYRVKIGGLKSNEYVYYSQITRGTDNSGNDRDFDEIIGKYEMPKAINKLEPNGERKVVGVSGHTTVYDIPFNAKLIEEWEDKGKIIENVRCYIFDGSRMYGEFSLENLKQRDFEDLVYHGKFGAFPTPEQKEMIVGPPSKRLGKVA